MNDLIERISLAVWLIFGGLLILSLTLGLNFLCVLLLFFATFFYVYTFFVSKKKRGPFLIYVTLMVLSLISYGAIYVDLGIVGPDSKAVRHYDYYYFSIITWTTLGYGDFRPSPEARMYAASQALLGYFYMGLLLGKLMHLFSNVQVGHEKANTNP